MDLERREFLLRFCQGAGATLIPATLTPSNFWAFAAAQPRATHPGTDPAPEYHLHPQYRSERPVDSTLGKVQAGSDEFLTEKYCDVMADLLDKWGSGILRSSNEWREIAGSLAPDFQGASLRPAESRVVRSGPPIEIRQNKFAQRAALGREPFLDDLQATLGTLSRVITAEFQITSIDAAATGQTRQPASLETRVRYEVVGTRPGLHREQRVGYWNLTWVQATSGEFHIRRWVVVEETQATSAEAVYVDITSAALAGNASYSAQMSHGTDYWRTILDGACGIDIYGHNGVSVADIDSDGFDDLYVCQPAGLPNRLYRNRGDGTFEDITESSGLGVLENTACALFADLSNSGRQDAIVVRASGPLLFLNDGGGKFRRKPGAFHFATPPQGTFTGAALADYDRDGWLDVYFCLYSFYQGAGQYRYPSPYHDAENGPPNFLMRNQRDGTFRDVTAQSGLNQNNTRYSFCCGWGNAGSRDSKGELCPDLYVVNDFGRKNLYRNNGDGTFTDVAPQAAAEDVGAGMSVSWLDYDNDNAQDLYVANMWTAAGERIATQEIFKKDSPKEVRALYHKHAMGNSLLRNRGVVFENATNHAGVGMGRWAWSSDALDFDHDGFPDLYITNGMVSGPLQLDESTSGPQGQNERNNDLRNGDPKNDLNSFFWRQVVAKSPDEARASKEYEQGWNAINELIRSDGTWSGYERNVFYANNRDGTFSDVSAVVGLDFIEDGRSFALADFDHDGRLEILLKNRNAPQLCLLKNALDSLPPSIAFRLQGTKSNRDAIGAAITVETREGRQARMLQAGSGFLAQHTKDVFFGLGAAKNSVHAQIRWPSGLTQELRDLPLNHRIWVTEGSEPARMEPFKKSRSDNSSPVSSGSGDGVQPERFPARVETWLLAPFPAPDFSLPDLSGQTHSLAALRGKPVLLNFWTPTSAGCREDLKTFQRGSAGWASRRLRLVLVIVSPGADVSLDAFRDGAYLTLRGTDEVAAIYNITYRQLFDRHRDLSLPTSFLIDANGNIVKLYQGLVNPEHIEQDFQHIPQTDAERLARALPFPPAGHTLEFGRNYLSYGVLFFQRGYLDQAEAAFQQALSDDPTSAEASYGVGSVYVHQNKNTAARQVLERTVKMQASYPDTLPDAWNNLGVVATRENRMADSVESFQQALKLNPHHLLALDNLGNAYRLEKRWDDARTVLERALQVAPDDPEANYSLGMVFAQQGDTGQAYEFLQRALKARPAYPEALNNLGVLYMMTERPDQAAASFQECIRAAPDFDQAYLNLARVYVLGGDREKARSTLLDLLKQHPHHEQAKQMLEQLQP